VRPAWAARTDRSGLGGAGEALAPPGHAVPPFFFDRGDCELSAALLGADGRASPPLPPRNGRLRRALHRSRTVQTGSAVGGGGGSCLPRLIA